jgi:hypothetical protein
VADGAEYHNRPNYGKAGKQIQVHANMYQARFKKQGLTIQSVCKCGLIDRSTTNAQAL